MEHQCIYSEKIDKLLEMMTENTLITKQVSGCLFGNGQPGIKTRFERMEGGIAVWKWIAGGGGIIGIASLIITVLKFVSA